MKPARAVGQAGGKAFRQRLPLGGEVTVAQFETALRWGQAVGLHVRFVWRETAVLPNGQQHGSWDALLVRTGYLRICYSFFWSNAVGRS